MRRHRKPSCAWFAAGLALALAVAPARACWQEVGERYGISPYLLYAMAKTESGLNPNAVNRRNANGSMDVGLMQINSAWFPRLKALGIEESQLYDACTNLEVGAWILAQNMRRLGRSWGAVGAYNAASADKRLGYARKVYRNLPPELQR
jgi:soluble lytic murein transglycosylase-like protein